MGTHLIDGKIKKPQTKSLKLDIKLQIPKLIRAV